MSDARVSEHYPSVILLSRELLHLGSSYEADEAKKKYDMSKQQLTEATFESFIFYSLAANKPIRLRGQICFRVPAELISN